MIDEYHKRYFDGICPYTDKKCEEWNCQECEVEKAEREYMEELQGEGKEGKQMKDIIKLLINIIVGAFECSLPAILAISIYEGYPMFIRVIIGIFCLTPLCEIWIYKMNRD